MQSKINIELKHFCPDFSKIRKVLAEMGAKKEIVKNQTDYFFNLPIEKIQRTGRLKLRIENKKHTLVYYERPDFKKSKGVAADIRLHEVKDNSLLIFLTHALGVSAMVIKKREVWRRRDTVFHLDTVNGVGKVFEVEMQKRGKIMSNDKAVFKAYQDKLLPFLGKVIKGSNVDLVKEKR